MLMSLFEIDVETLAGEVRNLSEYRGKLLLIVNTASQCGLTPQYRGLETLYQRFSGDGFVVLGFPCNQFGAQEPGSSEEIATFCQRNYGVSFPMHAKIDVNGPDTHPLFKTLKSGAKGLMGSEAIKWNFTKFLVNRQGDILKRYSSVTTPEKIAGDIEALLSSDS